MNIGNNQLRNLPKELGKLSNLKTLSVENNCLISIPKELKHIDSLKGIKIENDQSTTVDSPEIEHIKKLLKSIDSVELAFQLAKSLGYDIREIAYSIYPIEFFRYRFDKNAGLIHKVKKVLSWETLSFDHPSPTFDHPHSKLEEVFKKLSNLTNLESLTFEDGVLKDVNLPKEIGNFKNLKRLNFEGSDVNSLPKEIGDLSNLTYLNIRSYALRKVPNEITNLKNLSTLELYDDMLEMPKKLKEFWKQR